jgi:hypothetical protein
LIAIYRRIENTLSTEKKQFYKKKKFIPGTKKKNEDEKFDVEKWIKQHQNIETPKRGKKNSLGDKKNKRR